MKLSSSVLSRLTPLWLSILLFTVMIWISQPILSQKDAVFAFNDGAIESQLNEDSRPLNVLFRHWNNQFFFGQGLRTASLNNIQLFEWVLGAHQYRRYGVLIVIIFAGLAAYASCRLAGRSKPASFIAGVIACLCGWTVTFPMSGLTARAWMLSWTMLSIGLIQYGRRTEKILPYMLAGGFLGMAITDSPDVGVFAAVCCALYFLLSHFPSKEAFTKSSVLKISGLFLIYIAFSVLMAIQTVSNMFELYVKAPAAKSAVDASSSRDEKTFEWATQWSLPANETLSLIACDYHGASSRSLEHPYWGRMGRTDGWEKHRQGFRNFRLSGYALGTIPFLLLLYGGLLLKEQTKEERFQFYVLIGLALLTLALSWGKYFPLYRVVYEMPFLNSIRNPEKWMCGFFTFTVFAVAWAFDAVRTSAETMGKSNRTVPIWVIAGVLPLLFLFNLMALLNKKSFLQYLQTEGFGSAGNTILNNSTNALLTALFCSLIAGVSVALFLTIKKPKRPLQLCGVLTVLSIIELSSAAKPYVIQHHYRHLTRENELITLLLKDYPNNRIKVIPPQDPILNNFRLTWLRVQNFSHFDPISVRNMPADYSLLFESLQNNPLVLWKLGAVRHFVCSPQVAEQLLKQQGLFTLKALFTFTQSSDGSIHPKLIQRAPTNARYYTLLEYNHALPYIRFSSRYDTVPSGAKEHALILEKLRQTGPAWVDYLEDQHNESVVQANLQSEITVLSKTPTEVRINTTSSEDSLLIIAEKYDPYWVAEIDGASTPVLRANGILQSIRVPEGNHSITLKYQPPKNTLFISSAGFLTQGVLFLLFAISLISCHPFKP